MHRGTDTGASNGVEYLLLQFVFQSQCQPSDMSELYKLKRMEEY